MQCVLEEVTFLDKLATLGVTWDHMNDQDVHIFMDGMPQVHLMEFTAQMLCFVPRSNSPSLVKDWTQASHALVKLQAIMLALENSLAKHQVQLHIVTVPLTRTMI